MNIKEYKRRREINQFVKVLVLELSVMVEREDPKKGTFSTESGGEVGRSCSGNGFVNMDWSSSVQSRAVLSAER